MYCYKIQCRDDTCRTLTWSVSVKNKTKPQNRAIYMYMFLKFYFILGLIPHFELFKNCYIMKSDWRLINIRANEKPWEWDFVRVVRYWTTVKLGIIGQSVQNSIEFFMIMKPRLNNAVDVKILHLYHWHQWHWYLKELEKELGTSLQ